MAGNLKKKKRLDEKFIKKRRWWHRHFFGREVVCLFDFDFVVWFAFPDVVQVPTQRDSLVERFVRGLMSFSLLHQNGG